MLFFFLSEWRTEGKKKRTKLLIIKSGEPTKIERLTEGSPICLSPSFSNYQLTVSLHPLQLLWPQMTLKRIPDVRVGLGSGDALVIKFLGYSPCLPKHVSAEELGGLSLRETRSKSTSICVTLQICRGWPSPSPVCGGQLFPRGCCGQSLCNCLQSSLKIAHRFRPSPTL